MPLRDSQVYEPVLLLRQGDRDPVRRSRGHEGITAVHDPHAHGRTGLAARPLSSLSDVAWALRAHEWHSVTPEPVEQHERLAKTLARLLAARA